MTPDDLSGRLTDVAVRVLRLVEALPGKRSARHCGSQLLRCGTSGGANYSEARAAESREDFVHKCQVALKELRETEFWLGLIGRMGFVDGRRIAPLLQECHELVLILATSVSTAKRRARTVSEGV